MDLSKQNTLVLIDDRVNQPIEDLPNAMDWIVTQSIFHGFHGFIKTKHPCIYLKSRKTISVKTFTTMFSDSGV